jgi:hypothetical protein
MNRNTGFDVRQATSEIVLLLCTVFVLMLTGNHLRAGQGSGNVGFRVDKAGLAFKSHREDINLLAMEILTFH